MDAHRFAEGVFAVSAIVGAIVLLTALAAVDSHRRLRQDAQADCAQRCAWEAPPNEDVTAILDGWSCVCLTDEQAWRYGSAPGWVAPAPAAATTR